MRSLRIFYAVSRTPNSESLFNSNLWYLNLHPPLIELGHEVIDFNYDFTEHFNYYDLHNPEHQQFITQHRPILESRLMEQLMREHRRKPIDLFFSYFHDAFVSPDVIEEIKRIGITTVNFYCNAIHQFYLIETIAPHYDFCMVPEGEAVPTYRAAGANPVHIQMAANPSFYRPYDLLIRYPVTFVGQKYLNRPEYLYYLYRHGIDVHAFGPGWSESPLLLTPRQRIRAFGRRVKHLAKNTLRGSLSLTTIPQLPPRRRRGVLSDEELVKMYSRSAISLNFSEVYDQHTGAIKRHIRLRDFEAPMSGAFYFTGAQEELSAYYESGKEIIEYDTKEELLDKVRYYLRHETEARRIREAGTRRARRDHTWKKRFEQFFIETKLA